MAEHPNQPTPTPSDSANSSFGVGEMTLTRVFDAPRELVWDAFTIPEHFSAWFGGKDMSVPLQTVSLDVRPGGAWKATMEPAQGNPMPFAGTYLEVQKPEKLVMTFEDLTNPNNPNVETLTITLKDIGRKTDVTLHQAGHLPDDQYPKLVEGYGIFMDALAELLRTIQ